MPHPIIVYSCDYCIARFDDNAECIRHEQMLHRYHCTKCDVSTMVDDLDQMTPSSLMTSPPSSDHENRILKDDPEQQDDIKLNYDLINDRKSFIDSALNFDDDGASSNNGDADVLSYKDINDRPTFVKQFRVLNTLKRKRIDDITRPLFAKTEHIEDQETASSQSQPSPQMSILDMSIDRKSTTPGNMNSSDPSAWNNRFSREQKDLLMQLVQGKYGHIIMSANRSSHQKGYRDAAWQSITDELNTRYSTRFTVQQIKKRYSNEDQRIKGNFKRLRDEARSLMTMSQALTGLSTLSS